MQIGRAHTQRGDDESRADRSGNAKGVYFRRLDSRIYQTALAVSFKYSFRRRTMDLRQRRYHFRGEPVTEAEAALGEGWGDSPAGLFDLPGRRPYPLVRYVGSPTPKPRNARQDQDVLARLSPV